MVRITPPLMRVAVAIALGAGFALTSARVNAHETRQEERNRILVSRGFDAWRSGTGSPYDLLAAEARWTITGTSLAAKTYPTKEAFIAEVIRPFNARMGSRLVPSVRRLYADGDTVVAFFDAKGTARDGRAYENTYSWILRMQGEQIVEAHAFFDSKVFDDLWQRVSVPDE